MLHPILSNYSASISDLKKAPMSTLEEAHGETVAILNRNHPVFYCVPATVYEHMLEALDDANLVELVKLRENEPAIEVNLDDL
jgi:antitoxin StbD